MEDNDGAVSDHAAAADAAANHCESIEAHQEPPVKEKQPSSKTGGETAAKGPGKLTGRLREPDPSSEDDYDGNVPKYKNAVKKPLRCQVDGCGADLSQARKYFQRYRVCERHLKAPTLQMDGRSVRFCDQCSKFHDITMFEGSRRTCNEKLERTRQARSDKRRQQTEHSERAVLRSQEEERWRTRMMGVPGLKRPYSEEYGDVDDDDYDPETREFYLAKRSRKFPQFARPPPHFAPGALLAGLPDHLDPQGILAMQRAALAAAAAAAGGHDGGASSLSSWDDGSHPQLQLLRMDSVSSHPGNGSSSLGPGTVPGALPGSLAAAAAAAGYDPLLVPAAARAARQAAAARRALALGLGAGDAAHAEAALLLRELYGVGDGVSAAELAASGGLAAGAVGAVPRGARHLGAFGLGPGSGAVAAALLAAEQAELAAALEGHLPLGPAAAAAAAAQTRAGLLDDAAAAAALYGVGGVGTASSRYLAALREQQLLQLQAAAALEAQRGLGVPGVGLGAGLLGLGASRRLGVAEAARLAAAAAAEEELYGNGGTAAAVNGAGLPDDDSAVALGPAAAAAAGARGHARSLAAAAAAAAAAATNVHDAEVLEDELVAAELLVARLGGARGTGGLAPSRAATAAAATAAATAAAVNGTLELGGGALGAAAAAAAAAAMPPRSSSGRSMPVLNLAAAEEGAAAAADEGAAKETALQLLQHARQVRPLRSGQGEDEGEQQAGDITAGGQPPQPQQTEGSQQQQEQQRQQQQLQQQQVQRLQELQLQLLAMSGGGCAGTADAALSALPKQEGAGSVLSRQPSLRNRPEAADDAHNSTQQQEELGSAAATEPALARQGSGGVSRGSGGVGVGAGVMSGNGVGGGNGAGNNQFQHLRHLQEQLLQLGVKVVLQ